MRRFRLLFLVLGTALTQAVPLTSNDDLTADSTGNTEDIIDLSSYGSDLFGSPDTDKTAILLSKYNADVDEVNPEELGSYLEGDILIPKLKITMKNGWVTETSRWPKAIVPYEIRGNFNTIQMAIIEGAIDEYHKRTCIRFVPHTNESDYISINNDKSGCWSAVGRVGGEQKLNLQTPACLRRPGTVIHELMHALGFLHEQNRKERDDFVTIQYENIRLHGLKNFRKVSRTEAFGVPYDYGSVMHYSRRAFSINGEPTILPKEEIGWYRIGQRKGFSDLDVEKINRMYDCGPLEELGTENTEPNIDPELIIQATEGPDLESWLNFLISKFGVGDGAKSP